MTNQAPKHGKHLTEALEYAKWYEANVGPVTGTDNFPKTSATINNTQKEWEGPLFASELRKGDVVRLADEPEKWAEEIVDVERSGVAETPYRLAFTGGRGVQFADNSPAEWYRLNKPNLELAAVRAAIEALSKVVTMGVANSTEDSFGFTRILDARVVLLRWSQQLEAQPAAPSEPSAGADNRPVVCANCGKTFDVTLDEAADNDEFTCDECMDANEVALYDGAADIDAELASMGYRRAGQDSGWYVTLKDGIKVWATDITPDGDPIQPSAKATMTPKLIKLIKQFKTIMRRGDKLAPGDYTNDDRIERLNNRRQDIAGEIAELLGITEADVEADGSSSTEMVEKYIANLDKQSDAKSDALPPEAGPQQYCPKCGKPLKWLSFLKAWMAICQNEDCGWDQTKDIPGVTEGTPKGLGDFLTAPKSDAATGVKLTKAQAMALTRMAAGGMLWERHNHTSVNLIDNQPKSVVVGKVFHILLDNKLICVVKNQQYINRHYAITDAGRTALAAWEAQHGKGK